MATRETARAKCYITELSTGDTLHFDHIPNQVTTQKAANWNDVEILGRSEPLKGYSGSSAKAISLALQFSASYDQDDEGTYEKLETRLNFLDSLVYPEYEEHTIPPSRVLLSFGDWLKQVSIVRDISIQRNAPWDTQTVFPTTAEVTMTIEEANNNPFSRSDIRFRRHVSFENNRSVSQSWLKNFFEE